MFSGEKILLGVTGSIAAYKSLLLVRLFIKAGAEVKVIMTPAAKDFIAPLSFSTLSKNEVHSELFYNDSWSNHVMLGRWADIMIIAPASCNTLAKMANGLCDNLLLATYLSAVCPVIVAPAMDEDMWQHQSTSLNLDKLKSFGNQIIPVENGELASGLSGDGRMAEPETIFNYCEKIFSEEKILSNVNALVTAGPTHEYIDPVRYISNNSSGKMGIAIAEELADKGANVTLVLGPSQIIVSEKIKVIRVKSSDEMYDASMEHLQNSKVIVMSAAVADYRPENIASEKIKKKDDNFKITLLRTKDILKKTGELKTSSQILVGFALETNNEKENALLKLKEKNADLIIMNSLNDEGAGFQTDTNKITIFDKSGNQFEFKTKSKKEVAKDIVDAIIKYRHE